MAKVYKAMYIQSNLNYVKNTHVMVCIHKLLEENITMIAIKTNSQGWSLCAFPLLGFAFPSPSSLLLWNEFHVHAHNK